MKQDVGKWAVPLVALLSGPVLLMLLLGAAGAAAQEFKSYVGLWYVALALGAALLGFGITLLRKRTTSEQTGDWSSAPGWLVVLLAIYLILSPLVFRAVRTGEWAAVVLPLLPFVFGIIKARMRKPGK